MPLITAQSSNSVSFYPTYEELKLTNSANIKDGVIGFYPTYEELKLKAPTCQEVWEWCFYPTYEELKLAPKNGGEFTKVVVFTLPMRN